MTRIYVADLSEGMILASDLLTSTGRFILAAGSTLKSNHIKVLKSWGITEADIVDDGCPEGELRDIEVDASCREIAAIYLQEKFNHLDLKHELAQKLYQQAHQQICQHLGAGSALPGIPLISTPPEQEEVRINPTQMIRGDLQLTSLPEVYSRILETINSPRASSAAIAKIVSMDSNLSLRLLRLVNSAFYGFPGKIDSISRGITLIGTNELSVLALGLSVVKLFQDIPTKLIDMESFWKHSIRVGLFAQAIAGQKGGLSDEKFFVGGLLHDVGRLVMLKKIPEIYTRVILLAREEQQPLYQAEKNVLQCDHARIGRELAQEWSLPNALRQMIGGHHNPAPDRFALEPCIIHVADILAHSGGDELLLPFPIPPLQPKAWETIGLSPNFLLSMTQQVECQFQEIVSLFLGSAEG